jgi:hypothetical protein
MARIYGIQKRDLIMLSLREFKDLERDFRAYQESQRGD